MALIIRKFAKGDKIKKYKEPSDPVKKRRNFDPTFNGVTGGSTSSLTTSSNRPEFNPTAENTGNTDSNNVRYAFNPTAEGVGAVEVQVTPRPGVIKLNGQTGEWNWDTIKNAMIQVLNRTIANKQLNQKESTLANEWLESEIKNAYDNGSEIDITNKGIYIDGVKITANKDFYEGWDGKLRKEFAKDYTGDLLARQLGVIQSTDGSSNGNPAGSSWSPFDLPALTISNPTGSSTEEEKSEELLAIDAFNEANGTTGNPYEDWLLRQNNLVRFSKGNGNYILAKKNPDGSYSKVKDQTTPLIYDLFGYDNFGNIYVGINGVYRLLNKDSDISTETSDYLTEFNNINTPFKNSIESTYANRYNEYSDRELYYNPYIPGTSKVMDIKDHFSGGSDVKSVYVNLDSEKTHFGYIDPDKLIGKDIRIVVSTLDENGKQMYEAKNVSIKKENGVYKGTDSEGKTYDLGTFTKLKQEYKDGNYKPLNYDKLIGSDGKDVPMEDLISDSFWDWGSVSQDPGDYIAKANSVDDFLKLENAGTTLKTALTNLNSEIDKVGFNKDKAKSRYLALYNLVIEYAKIKKDDVYYELLPLLHSIYNKLVPQPVVVSNKKGGYIRRYQTGGGLLSDIKNVELIDYTKNPVVHQQVERGVGKDRATLDNMDSWSGTDVARGVAVGLDAASLAGGVVGFGAGLAATGTELVADLIDYNSGKISGSDLAWNVAMNLGFTILSIIPGMASAKIAKNAVKGGAKVAKSLKKVEKIAELAHDASQTENVITAAKTLDNVGTTLKPNDIENIIKAAKEILPKVDAEGYAKIQKVIDECEQINKVMKKTNATQLMAKMGPAVNVGMASLGIGYGLSESFDVLDKAVHGDFEDISLQNLQGIISLVGGAKGASQAFRNYALKRGITDIDMPISNTSTNDGLAEINLKADGKDIKFTANSKSKGDVKLALNRDIETFKAKRVEVETKLRTASEAEKPQIQKELNDIDAEIKLRKDVVNDFDNFYKEPNKITNWAKNQANNIKGGYTNFTNKFKSYDYRNKKLIEDSDDLSWIQKRGRKYAIREGFTEDGFDASKVPFMLNEVSKTKVNKFLDRYFPKWNLTNRDKRRLAGEFNKKSNQQSESTLTERTVENTSTTSLNTPKTSVTTPESTSSVVTPVTSNTSTNSTLVSNAINKILTKNSKNSIHNILKSLKGNKSHKISQEEKSSLKEAVDKVKGLNSTQISKIKREIDLLKEGGSVKIKKYLDGDPVSDATNSTEDPTKTGTIPLNLPDTNLIFTSNEQDGTVQKSNHWWSKLAVVPEAMNIAAKTANAWAGTNKIFDIQLKIEAAKKQYPYIHLPVLEDLAGYLYLKNAINEGRANLNKNLTSDSSLQTATGLEFNKQAIESTNKLNALRSQDLSSLRLKSLTQEYENEKNRIDTANNNNAVDVELAKYKHMLDALKISTLTSIMNTNLELNGLLFNKIMKSATDLEAAKYKDLLTQDYYNKTDRHNMYVSKYDTYDKSPHKAYEAALGIDGDTVVTQDHINSLLEKYKQQFPNITDAEIKKLTIDLNNLLGKTLKQSYDIAYKYHENALINEGRRYLSLIGLADEQANYNLYYLTPSRIKSPTYKKGGSFTETKYKTDAKSKDVHKKLALEYAKLIHKQHQENMKNALPFLLHSYKNTTSK